MLRPKSPTWPTFFGTAILWALALLCAAAAAAQGSAPTAGPGYVLLTPTEAAEASACWAEAPVLRTGLDDAAARADTLRQRADSAVAAAARASADLGALRMAVLEERAACGRLADALRDESDELRRDVRRAKLAGWIRTGGGLAIGVAIGGAAVLLLGP